MIFYALLVAFGMSQVSMFFTEVYVHRYLAHRSFWLHPLARFIMHVWIAIFIGLNVRQWSAVHRIHHQYADTDHDPHSPHFFGAPRVFFGSFFLFHEAAKDPATVEKWTKDYIPDHVDAVPMIGYRRIVGLALLILLFGWTIGLVIGVTHLMMYLVLFGLLNTLGHSNDAPVDAHAGNTVNVRWLSLLTAGESLHRNHHIDPANPKFSVEKDELDPGWWMIRLLVRMRLAKVTER